MPNYFCPLRASLENKNCVGEECMWWFEEGEEEGEKRAGICAVPNIPLALSAVNDSVDKLLISMNAFVESFK